MGRANFCGGGSLDGEFELPPGIMSVVTAERDGTRSYYVFDALAGAYRFTGFNDVGRVMGRIARAFSAEARAEREQLEEAMRPASCTACGRTFGSAAARMVHFEGGSGRCLPDSRLEGQLVNRDGVLCLPGSDVSRL
jgi:hypothetical protein